MAEDLGSMIEKAMADPRFGEIFGMLKSKADSGELDVSKMGELLGGSGGEAEKDTSEKGGSGPDISSLLGGLPGKGKKSDFAKHERLLRALKPYLSDNKKNAVDTVVKAAHIGDILETFGGMVPPANKG
ncbi:MAG: hypothetical protein E7660_05175 [Ruminococcaceae bacterium]|nr:hypothetical protein [Oscillospiraceae bacterium]